MSAERVWAAGRPVDLRSTLGVLRRGTADPCYRVDPGGRLWRASRTPDGPGTLALSVARGEVSGEAWGPGAEWLLEHLPRLLGAEDDWSGLDVSAVPALESTRRRLPGLRLVHTGLIFESLVPAVLEQKVTGVEARRAWQHLVRRYGEPAPGPHPALRVPPTPRGWLDIPTWEWHRAGVEGNRTRTIRAAASVAARLDEAAQLTPEAAAARLRLVPGVGEWTAAEVVQRALGAPDTVSVGDYHLKNQVVHLLTGRARGTDEEMVELLGRWPGQRQRVMRLVEASGVSAPRFGPKFNYTDIRAI